MIQRLSHRTLYVLDQDAAKQFYTEKLGFEVRNDAHLGGGRWLAVSPKGQANFELVLMPLNPGPMLSAETAEALRGLVERGTFGGGVLEG